MSIKMVNQIWETSKQTGTALLMLLAIADHANDDGICWPSIERLAQRTRVSKRQAQYIIKQLEDAGEITIQRGQGRGNTSLYILKGAADCTINEAEKVQSAAPKREIKGAIQREKVQSSALKGAAHCTQNHIEPPIEPSREKAEGATRPAAPSATDPDTAMVWDVWLRNMPGVITDIIAENLHEMIDEYGAMDVVRGITIQVERGKHSAGVRYLRGIMERGVHSQPVKPGNTPRDGPSVAPSQHDAVFARVRERLAQHDVTI